MPRILIVDNSIGRGVYTPVEDWTPYLEFPFDVVHSVSNEMSLTLTSYTHVVVTGSESSIVEQSNWMLRAQSLLRRAVDDGKIILASCFGHQMLTVALFGSSCVKKASRPEIGWIDIDIIKEDSLFGEKGTVQTCFAIHFDEIICPYSDDIEILASSKHCRVHGFRIKNRPVWGIQSHPEINVVSGLRIINNMKEAGVPSGFISSTCKDSGWIHQLMKVFHGCS